MDIGMDTAPGSRRRRRAPAQGAAHAAAWLAVAGALLLGGCGTSGIDTAYQLMEQQKEEQAMIRQHELEQERKQAPTQPRLMLTVIRESQAQGRYFASLAYIDAYARRFGANPEVEVLRANALRMTGQAAQSESAYRALIRDGRAAEGWHGLGLLAGARGDFAGAARDLSKAADLMPTDADVLNDLGYARLRAGDLAGARLPLGKAAELAPENSRILANLALLLLLEGDASGAQRLMAQANLAADVRNQVYRQADDIQRQAYSSSRPSAATPAVAAADAAPAAASRPIVARVPEDGAASGSTPYPTADRTASQGNPILPIQPMMERFAYPPVAR